MYAKIRREFSAAELQKYTEIEEMVPLRDVVAKVDALEKSYLSKRKRPINARRKERKSAI